MNKPFPFKTSLVLLMLALLSACAGPISASSLARDLRGLSADESATLQSLQKLDDYPLYTMRYSGAYSTLWTGASFPHERAFGCSLFAALSHQGDKLYGRNFDWDFSPALLLFTDPPDGYASVSMVDLTFLDIDPSEAGSMMDLPLSKRTALLRAPTMPFDGMNEYGLAIGMAAVPDTGENPGGSDPSKTTIGSIAIIREILDHARTVDDAVSQFEQYNIIFTGGPPIHYLIADATGKAVLVEFNEGKRILLPNQDPWHLATNHLRCTAQGDGGCWRYHKLSEQLAAANGRIDAGAAMQLLSKVAQSKTQWSITYNLTHGDVSVVIGQRYQKEYPFQLELAAP